MSDHDAPSDPMTPDPMDKAYVEAQALLADEAARAARRARVLAAVAGEAAATPDVVSSPARRANWGRGGWLVAASVAGVGVFLATQVYLPALTPQRIAPVAPAAPAAPAAAASEVAVPPAPAARTPAPQPAPKPAARTDAAAPQAEKAASEDRAQAAPAPAPPAAQAFAPARRAAPEAAPAPPANTGVEEMVVTAERRAPFRALSAKAGSPAERAERLRDAAAAGRTAEAAALLSAKVPVDSADEAGETALMKAIEANQPATAALLRRHGASLDRKNQAGVSARDMATAMGEPELNRALGLGPPP